MENKNETTINMDGRAKLPDTIKERINFELDVLTSMYPNALPFTKLLRLLERYFLLPVTSDGKIWNGSMHGDSGSVELLIAIEQDSGYQLVKDIKFKVDWSRSAGGSSTITAKLYNPRLNELYLMDKSRVVTLARHVAKSLDYDPGNCIECVIQLLNMIGVKQAIQKANEDDSHEVVLAVKDAKQSIHNILTAIDRS